MNVAEKQLDDFMDEFKVKLKVLVDQMIKEKHAELWAEHQKLQYRMAELEKQIKEMGEELPWKKNEIIWEK